jgi:hypothetical protein
LYLATTCPTRMRPYFSVHLKGHIKTGLTVLLINYKTAKEINGLCERTKFKKSQYQYDIGKTWWV